MWYIYWQNRSTISIIPDIFFFGQEKVQRKQYQPQQNARNSETHIAGREEHLLEGLGYGGHQACSGDALGGLGVVWSRGLILCQEIIRLERNRAEHHPLQ
jgi:hypothetical protein